jgi:hypothetical protein
MILMLDLDCLGSQFFWGLCVEVGVGVEICPLMLSSEGLSNINNNNNNNIAFCPKQVGVIQESSTFY